jgi:hypothetical protein
MGCWPGANRNFTKDCGPAIAGRTGGRTRLGLLWKATPSAACRNLSLLSARARVKIKVSQAGRRKVGHAWANSHNVSAKTWEMSVRGTFSGTRRAKCKSTLSLGTSPLVPLYLSKQTKSLNAGVKFI